jgi:glycosyltransferase involved in cell wall biosynthesis
MPPSVLIIGPSPPPYGGMALQAGALVERLRQDGVDVEFLATNPVIPNLVARLKGIRTALQSVIFLCRLCVALRRRSVVHVLAASHWYFFLRVVPAVMLAKGFSRRVILNYRGGEAPRFFSRYRWLVLPVLRMVDEIAVPSAYLHRVFAEDGFSAAIIPNFVDLRRFHFRQRSRLVPRLLVNRALEPLYNVRMALDAYTIIKKRRAEARLDVVGTGSEEASLKSWAAQLGVPDINFHGAVPNEAMPLYLEGADILLNPSNADNMPISLLEAFAAGVPVVTTNVGGIPDLVGPEETALLVAAGDSIAMADKVEELLNEPQRVTSLTRRAKALSDQTSWDRVGRLWLAIYSPDKQTLKVKIKLAGKLTKTERSQH